ncbi:flagellar hook-associated protein FlgL [Bacillus sp. V5-8f]|uniref:flagellar hook-associated protein FlgL n=1 Tax=Bacillus sp. V5-8f TaxID=2053044 RepID=UPI000C7669B0|nr:flagellar hook-associated protein FlgL [Bacillus sp. V5-8f]PLT35708.1 flagellar hook-associated protein FlgL [Bacillus sp. V5-8f]
MRITQGMLASNSLRNLTKSYAQMGKYQDQLATNKKITKPSDDPVVAMKGMYYRSNLSEVEQYKRNLSELYLWMENSEAGVDQAQQGLQRLRELMVQANNGTLTTQDQSAIAREVEQIKEDLAKVANTKVGGRYIFHGTDVGNPVVDETTFKVASNVDDPAINSYNVEVSRGVELKANISPSEVFSQELFNVVGEAQSSLDSGQQEKLESLLSRLDSVMEGISAERSEMGARYNRLEIIDSRIGQQEIISNRVLSDNEDVDIEKVITDLTVQESVHRAALSVGARIIQPTLMDFLR